MEGHCPIPNCASSIEASAVEAEEEGCSFQRWGRPVQSGSEEPCPCRYSTANAPGRAFAAADGAAADRLAAVGAAGAVELAAAALLHADTERRRRRRRRRLAAVAELAVAAATSPKGPIAHSTGETSDRCPARGADALRRGWAAAAAEESGSEASCWRYWRRGAGSSCTAAPSAAATMADRWSKSREGEAVDSADEGTIRGS